jgi:hypothetical protein
MITLFCLLPACGGFAQSTNSLHVEVSMWPDRDTNFPAHTDIQMMAFVSMDGPHREDDSVKVEFFANAKSLGKKTSFWHSAEKPGRALYFHMTAAHFDSVPLVWRNPPAGNYAITALATFSKTVKAVSTPVNIVVTP